LAAADMGGVTRAIKVGLLDEPLGPGDKVLESHPAPARTRIPKMIF
jgi:hypothetical protein